MVGLKGIQSRCQLACSALVLPKRDANVNIKCNPIIETFHSFSLTCDLKRYMVTWHNFLCTRLQSSVVVFPR